ncbi:MAG: hypothetical protein IPM47_09425 [Sphingobacteriales bacterium]|nr:MAG: hypothetical protein IPM47_09425 [Sphingobacteriales bacterium]
MKIVTFLLVCLFLLIVSCSKEEDSNLITEEAKTDCVWKTPNNKIIPCQFKDKWEKYEQEKERNWYYKTLYCTTDELLPGIKCISGGNDCSSAFGCTYCLNC